MAVHISKSKKLWLESPAHRHFVSVLADIIQYCTDDLTYVGVVTEPYYTIQPMVPYGYANSNATIAAQ